MGTLPLLNVVKTDDRGHQVELVKLLMSGASEQVGMHFDGVAMRPGGRWKGFPASYWLRWDGVVEEQCVKETYGMESAIIRFEGQNITMDNNEYNASELVEAYRNKKVSGIGDLL